MANRSVQLYMYVKIDGRWQYRKAVFHDNNKIKAHAIRTSLGEQIIKDGTYVLSYGRRWEPVGNDPTEAVRALLKKRGELLHTANGGTIQSETPQPKVSGTLKSAFDVWLQANIDGGAHSETVRAKRLVATSFMKSCKVKMLSSVTRQMCLRYINEHLIKQGNGGRTRFNKALHLKQWLKFHKLDLLTSADMPDYTTDDPVALEDDELDLFWQACPGHKRLLYTVLLQCGLRKQEIQTLRWVDIVGGNEPHIKIQERPEYGYVPKLHHCRKVPLADPKLYAALMDWKLVSKGPLVFHTKSGKPLTHLWEDTQAIFRKAGVDMEKGHPHCFRATYCTTLLRNNVPIPDIMAVMGHLDVESTMRYMAVLRKKDLHNKMAAVKFRAAA